MKSYKLPLVRRIILIQLIDGLINIQQESWDNVQIRTVVTFQKAGLPTEDKNTAIDINYIRTNYEYQLSEMELMLVLLMKLEGNKIRNPRNPKKGIYNTSKQQNQKTWNKGFLKISSNR